MLSKLGTKVLGLLLEVALTVVNQMHKILQHLVLYLVHMHTL